MQNLRSEVFLAVKGQNYLENYLAEKPEPDSFTALRKLLAENEEPAAGEAPAEEAADKPEE